MNRKMPLKNPFVGLRPFESEDSLYYFGRNEQTKTLLRQLHKNRFIAVVGGSGSGKSSLIRAGLIPHLEAGFLAQNRDIWLIASMKPGDAPIHNLADSILDAIGESSTDEHVESIIDRIRKKGSRAILEIINSASDARDANFLLLVDQFEELFRFRNEVVKDTGMEESADFVSIMLQLVEQKDVPVFVCMTMRSDFLGDCNAFYGLPEAMNQSQYLVPRLTREQRRAAIAGPLRLSGVDITPRLLDRLLNENIGMRDDLPILQHALMRTWSVWSKDGSGGPIDIDHYEETGAVRNALSRHAEEALEELHDSDKRIVKKLFQTITETDAGNRRIRRPVHLSEIAEVTDTPIEKIFEVIDKFRAGDRNFLTLSKIPVDDPLVNISHESFIRLWNRLTGWVDEEAESAKVFIRLAETSELHTKDKAGLYREADLQIALKWKEESKPNAAWARRYHDGFEKGMAFLDESRKEKEKIRNAKKRELEEKERLLRKTRVFSIVIFLLFVAASITAGWAFHLNRMAQQQEKIANTQTLTANYNLAMVFEEKAISALKDAHVQNKNRVGSFKNALLFASAALEQKIAPDKTALQYACMGRLFDPDVMMSAFAEKWFSSAVNFHSGSVLALAFSPNGNTFASASKDEIIRLWNVQTGEQIREFIGHTDSVYSVAFSPGGNTIASGSEDNTILLWNAQTGEQIRELKGHTGAVNSVAFSPDGNTIASGSEDKTIRLWSVETGEQIHELRGHKIPVYSVAFSSDGITFASASGFKELKLRKEDIEKLQPYCSIRLWNVQTGKQIRELNGHTDSIWSVAFSPDGNTIASGSEDETILLWNAKTGKQIRELKGHTDSIWSVAFSPDGNTIVSGSEDETILLWNAQTGKQIRELKEHTDAVNSVLFSPDGNTIASGSKDNTIRLWNSQTGEQIPELKGCASDVYSIAFSHDGATIASGSQDETIRVWNSQTGEQIRELKGHTGAVYSVAFSPDGNKIASGSEDKTIRLWRVDTGEQIHELRGHKMFVYSVAFSSDGATIASASGFNKLNIEERKIKEMQKKCSIRLWNVQTGKQISELKGHTDSIRSVAFNPDGNTIASGSEDETIRLWNAQTGEQIHELKGHTDAVNSVVFSPDGNTIASGSHDETIRLWNVQSGKQKSELKGHESVVYSVFFSPDGATIASGTQDETIRLWNVQTGEQIRQLVGHKGSVNSVLFSPDGATIASGSQDKTIRQWEVRTGEQIRELKGHTDSVYSVAFSLDGKIIASVSRDDTIRLWNAQTGEQILELKEHTNSVRSVAFSPDGNTLASGSEDEIINLWNAQTGEQIHELRGCASDVYSVAFSPDGNTLASGSRDRRIRLWNAKTGEQIHELKGHTSDVNSVVFSPDGNTIASGSRDRTIRLWNAQTGEQIHELKGHTNSVRSVAFSPDGSTIASGSGEKLSENNTIRLWNVQTGEHIRELKKLGSVVYSVVFSPDGNTIASGSRDETIRLWNAQTGEQIRELKGHKGSVNSVVFSPDGATIVSGSEDKTIRIWDISSYTLFLNNGKPTALYKEFVEGMKFFWQVERKGLMFKRKYTPVLYAQDGYQFNYDKKFRPLLNPPAPGQTKYDQILEWARNQVVEE